jgi:hypothetical protein
MSLRGGPEQKGSLVLGIREGGDALHKPCSQPHLTPESD